MNRERYSTDDRFAFGQNWQRFSRYIDEDRINASIRNLRRLTGEENLEGKKFLDVGCGSGLSSLAAVRMGAQVLSFDYDGDSVLTAQALKKSQGYENDRWQIEQGSVLEENYMQGLGKFDLVYSWGVLHHTGDMWHAIEKAAEVVKPGGKLAIALYNDQGGASRRWLEIKKRYVNGTRLTRVLIVFWTVLFFEVRGLLIRLVRFQNPLPFNDWKQRRQDRGMSVFHDLVDWVGGYPFEVAKPEEVFQFLKQLGFTLENMKTCAGGQGCNEFLFKRSME